MYNTSQRDRHTVVIIDEAQAIRDEKTLEALRLLLNFQLNNRFLLTLLLFGQPELREKVAQLKQFEQRIALRYHLDHLSEEETVNYIKYRCQVAGCEKEIFTEDAYHSIMMNSGGIPRIINTISDTSLLVGMNQNIEKINKSITEGVAKDLNLISDVKV